MRNVFYLTLSQVVIVGLLLLGGLVLPVSAQRVALLPLADFSRGLDGVNLPFTQVVENSLKNLGIDMVPQEQVLQFMAETRLRSFSYLDSFSVQKLGKELKCAVVLLGTVTEIGGRNPVLGLTFTALDTVSGNPVWSETGATSILEHAHLLAINEPKTELELAGPLLENLLQHLWGTVEEGAIPNERSYQLTGMQLFPAYVRGRQRIEASLKIDFLHAQPVEIAVESPTGKIYLQQDARTGIYRGQLISPEGDGVYPLDLILEWGTGRFEERVENLSSFQVINQPPGLKIEVKKARPVDGLLAFRTHILVLPRILDLKPMARWALEIRDAAGSLLALQEYEGDMPERMVWEGRGSDGSLLGDGEYEIVLHVWDLAGNQSSDSCRVAMQRNAPKIKVETFARHGKNLLRVAAVERVVFPLENWTLDLETQQGETLLQVAGVELPQVLELPPPNDDEKLFFNFFGRDCLGNRVEMVHRELLVPQLTAADKKRKADAWVQDF